MAAGDIQQLTDAMPFEVSRNGAITSSPGGVESALIAWMIPSQHEISPYWSPVRDSQLRLLWRKVDIFKIAVATFVNKAVTIPLHINPFDRSIRTHSDLASTMERDLKRNSGLFTGWKTQFKKFILDYLTQDNGAFMMVMGNGPVNQPIRGQALGVFHLDSARCTRTGVPEFPVVYSHIDGKRYALHYTRVIYLSNLPSAELDMYDVGHSPVSCALDAGIEVRDVYTYMQEKLGSRPKRQILYAETGATRDQMLDAIEYGDEKMDSEGLKRFSKTLVMAPKNANGKLVLNSIDLASTPDQFNRMDIAVIDISAVAAAFGLDIQDLSVAYGLSSGTRSTAEVQERKGRGKGVGELLESVAEQIDDKILPESLFSSFDNQDDGQDEQQAKIWDTRSTARQRDLTTGSTTVPVERARMLRNGEITDAEYAEMELTDGRLPNGLDVLSLFFTTNSYIAPLLAIPGVDNPILVDENDPTEMIDRLNDMERAAYVRATDAQSANVTTLAKQALTAIQRLRALYQERRDAEEALLLQQEQQQPSIDSEDVQPGDLQGQNNNVTV